MGLIWVHIQEMKFEENIKNKDPLTLGQEDSFIVY